MHQALHEQHNLKHGVKHFYLTGKDVVIMVNRPLHGSSLKVFSIIDATLA